MSSDLKIHICRSTLKSLKYSFIWPNETDEINPGKAYYFRVGIVLSITTGWVISVFMHLFLTLKNKIDIQVNEDCAALVAVIGVYYITIIYVKNQPKIALLLQDLSNFQFGKPPNFEETNRRLSFWSQCCFYYALFGITCYALIQFLQKPECEKRNKEKNLDENCGIVSPTWFPFSTKNPQVYYLTLFYIFCSIQILMKLGLMISFNALEMANHIILRIHHLRSMIMECFDDENCELNRRKFQICVLYHLEIIDLSTRLDDCFSNGMFVHFSMTAAICGCLEKQFVDDDSNINRICAVIHVAGWIIALFIACLGGQQLINASDLIPDTVWSSKWYKTDVKLQKDVLFMLARSQKNLHIGAGSFSYLSLPLFYSVLKMSYSILAVLTS